MEWVLEIGGGYELESVLDGEWKNNLKSEDHTMILWSNVSRGEGRGVGGGRL